MNFLIYIERSAENLQFFLWYRDYEKRFNEAPASERALAPEWTKAKDDEAVARIRKEAAGAKKKPAPGEEIFKGTDFDKSTTKREHAFAALATEKDPFSTPPGTAASLAPSSEQDSVFASSTANTHRSRAEEAYAAAGVKAPCKPILPTSLSLALKFDHCMYRSNALR